MINTKSDNVRPHVSPSSDPKIKSVLQFLSYIRYPIGAIVVLLLTAVYCVYVAILCGLVGHARPVVQRTFRSWARNVLWVFNIKVKAKGLEYLPKAGSLLLFNHASHFDIPIICSAVDKVSRFGAKIELFKIPFLSLAMRSTGVLPIARGRREHVLQIYQKSVPRLHNGESFLLAPEGTRQSSPGLGSFKQGPFIFAIQAQAPIVPIVIEGALGIMPKNTLRVMWGRWSHTVQLQVLEPIATQGKTLDDLESVMTEVHAKMSQAYQSLREASYAH